eukprot:1023404-Pyramimonas_sp.AAC.1
MSEEAAGGLRRLQEATGRSRRPQEATRGPMRQQEAPGGTRRPWKAPGGPKRSQEQEASEGHGSGSNPMRCTCVLVDCVGARILGVSR